MRNLSMRQHPVRSILDTDLYQFTMQQAILKLYPNAIAEDKFFCRTPNIHFSKKCVNSIRNDICTMSTYRLTDIEKKWLQKTCPFLYPDYLEYLSNYKFDPSQVKICLRNGKLSILIEGPWIEQILWEQPILMIVTANYFEFEDKFWSFDADEYRRNLYNKISVLLKAGCYWADFGTRRRRSYEIQKLVNEVFSVLARTHYIGTSNVDIAKIYNLKPIGTMAHKWIMAHQVLSGIRHCNREALQSWNSVYNGMLGIALTDTIGTDAFYRDFNLVLAKLFDGVRQDSGDPLEFAEKTIAFYKQIGIDPKSKTIVFSDGLNAEKAAEIQHHLMGRIKSSYGIGTNFTNDFKESPALNIVVKLVKLNDIPVVKLGDGTGKEVGDPDALRVTKWIVNQTPLDE